MIRAHFLKRGWGVYDLAIALWTRSPVIHVGIEVGPLYYEANPKAGVTYGAVPQGPRWSTVEVPGGLADEIRMTNFLMGEVGKAYDWRGIFLSQAAPLVARENEAKWFCSELVIEALRRNDSVEDHIIDASKRYSPAMVYDLLGTLAPIAKGT